MAGLIARLDAMTRLAGRLAAACCLLMVIFTGTVVVLRYGFGRGSIALQELVNYLHAGVFMLGAAVTLQSNGHVRVDVFYRRCSVRTRAWVDSLGTILLLLPLCIFIGLVSRDYVLDAWSIRETSTDPGGLPFVYLWKSLIPVMAGLLILQGLAEILRNLLVLSAPPGPTA